MINSAQGARLRAVTRQAGEIAHAAGLYLVTHAREHRAPHLALVLRGDTFPRCRSCKAEVTFTLEQRVEYLLHDMDFAGPELLK